MYAFAVDKNENLWLLCGILTPQNFYTNKNSKRFTDKFVKVKYYDVLTTNREEFYTLFGNSGYIEIHPKMTGHNMWSLYVNTLGIQGLPKHVIEQVKDKIRKIDYEGEFEGVHY